MGNFNTNLLNIRTTLVEILIFILINRLFKLNLLCLSNKIKTMKTLKLLWNSLGIVQAINIIIRHKNVILLLLSPLLVAYILGYMFLILTGFILWKIPETIPIPFVGNSMFDRVLIILGVILVFLDIIDSKSKR